MLGGGHTNATYYDGVRVPHSAVVGEVNGGWRLITAQLNHERVGLAPSGNIDGPLRRVTAWAKDTSGPDGRRVIDHQWVRLALARVWARNDALKLYNWKVASALESAALSPADASAMKVFGTELKLEAFRSLMEVLGQGAYITKNSPAAIIEGELEHAYRGAGGHVRRRRQRGTARDHRHGRLGHAARAAPGRTHHCVVMPPLTRKMLPVAHRPASDAR